jgi:hypothetical protein
MKFRVNMSRMDQRVRMALGCIFLTLAITDILIADPMSSVLIGIVGTLALVSGLLRYCILYEFTGLATYPPVEDDTKS